MRSVSIACVSIVFCIVCSGQRIEEEVQQLATTALDYLTPRNVPDTAYEAALDVIRSLPARTVNEVRFVWQVVQLATDSHISNACAQALVTAEPKDAAAWKEIEQGKTSSIKEIRETAETVLRRRK